MLLWFSNTVFCNLKEISTGLAKSGKFILGVGSRSVD
jgi:hypothetical protein